MNVFEIVLLLGCAVLLALILVVLRSGAVDKAKAEDAIDEVVSNVGHEADVAGAAAGGFLARLFRRTS